jgi:putative membrane protein
MHMTLLGVLLALAPRPLYGAGDVSCFGISLSAAADQQIGGVVMLMVGACAYLLGGIVLLAGLLRDGDALPAEKPRC